MKGIVRRFYVRKGFGFIEGDLGTEYFFHYTEFSGEKRHLAPGLEVEFEPRAGHKGPSAGAVRATGQPVPTPAHTAPVSSAPRVRTPPAAQRPAATPPPRRWVVPFGAGLAFGLMMGIGTYALFIE